MNNRLKKSIKYIILKLEYHSLIMAQRISIPVKDLIQSQYVGKSMAGEDDTCMCSLRSRPSIISDDDDDNDDDTLNDILVFIFGDFVLRSIYLVFDVFRNQIGFASAIDSNTQDCHSITIGPICFI